MQEHGRKCQSLRPIGNWGLWYDRETDLRDIHTDFKKLLRLSKIG